MQGDSQVIIIQRRQVLRALGPAGEALAPTLLTRGLESTGGKLKKKIYLSGTVWYAA